MSRFAFTLLLFAALPLRANLGDSVGDCVKRYGHPVAFSEASLKFPFGTVVFSAGPYTLIVFLHGTTEVGARVSKNDKSAFTDAEIKTIMDADTAGAGWTPASSDDPTSKRWTRGDKATALYDQDKHVLIFTTEEMDLAMRNGTGVPPPPGDASVRAALSTNAPATGPDGLRRPPPPPPAPSP